MKKLIAAVAATVLLTLGTASGVYYVSQTYTFVDGSAIHNDTMEHINKFGAVRAMQGYQMGLQACNKGS